MLRELDSLRRVLCLAVTVLLFLAAIRAVGAETVVPPELERWRAWVLRDHSIDVCGPSA